MPPARAPSLPAAAALALLAGACSTPDPPGTPEAAARALVAAANRGDVAGMRAAAITPARLRRALTCPPGETDVDILEAVADAHETMSERAGMKVELTSITEESRRAVAAGDDYRGCRAAEPFELRRLRMQLSLDDGTGRRDKREAGDAIRLDGRWYLVIPSP